MIKGEIIQYEENACPVIEFFCLDGIEYPVIEHPLETPPELANTGALGFDPNAKVIKMRGVPEEFRGYGYFNEVQCLDALRSTFIIQESNIANYLKAAKNLKVENYQLIFLSSVFVLKEGEPFLLFGKVTSNRSEA